MSGKRILLLLEYMQVANHTKNKRRIQGMKFDTGSLAHTKWNYKYLAENK